MALLEERRAEESASKDETGLRVGCLQTGRRVMAVYGLKLEIGNLRQGRSAQN